MYDFRQYPLEFTPDSSVSAEEDYVYKRRMIGSASDEKKDDDAKECATAQRFGNVLNTPSLLLNGWTNEPNKRAAANPTAQTQPDAPAANVAQNAAASSVAASVQRAMTLYGNTNRKESDPANL